MKKLLFLLSFAFTLNFAIGQGSMACNNDIQVSVDDACNALIDPDMILEGTYDDYNDYEVRIYNVMPNPINSPGTVANPVGPGNYIVGIFETATGNNCWGNIIVLDKLPPTIDCQCPEGGAIPQGEVFVSPFNESFSATDNSDELPDDCDAIALALGIEDGSHYYDIYVINVSATGTYTFTGSDDNGKLIIAVLDQELDLSSSCDDILPHIVGQFDETDQGTYDGSANLDAGVTYYVILSDKDADYIGDYNFSIDTPVGEEVTMAETFYNSECLFDGCYEDEVVYAFPVPEVNDNCTITYLDYTQTVTDGAECGTYIVKRKYTVTDGAGMKSSCTSEFFFKGVDINNLEWPLNWDDLPGNHAMIECSTDYTLDAAGNPHPSYTGYPSGFSNACGTIEVFYTDKVYTKEDGVPCGTKTLRYWTLVDDCTGIIYEHTQIIRTTDTTAPTFLAPSDLTAKTKAYVCNSNVEIPALHHLADNCDSNPIWWITSEDGIVVGDVNGNGYVDAGETWHVDNLELGEHTVCYHVSDDCDNVDEYCIYISVVDGVPPIPVCEEHKQVGITVSGNAKVWATSFNSGSFDNCNPVFFKVLRVNDDLVYDGGCSDLNGDDKPSTTNIDVWYDDDVFFCCDDVNNEIMVSLRVFDVDPGAGPINPTRMTAGHDLFGHYNDCWSIVKLECKIPPTLECPAITVSCEDSLDPDENSDLLPTVNSVCGYDLEYTDKRDLGVCGAKIVRTWTATGCGKTTTCKQKITVESTEPFDPCSIIFPKDIKADCSNDLANGGEPTWDENPCNVVTAEVIKEDTFKFVDGACYKIVREWAVVDWCVYESNTGAEFNVDVVEGRKLNCDFLVEDGYYRYTQILMVTDSETPEIQVEDQCFASTDCYAYNLQIGASATDSCNVNQKFNWKYIVTNMDTWETIQYSYNYIPNPAQGVKGNRHKDNIDNTANAYLKLINELPVGDYRVTWTVGDGCGNATSKNQFFTVADKKPPTPLFVDLATAVMLPDANGVSMVELIARSFDKGGCENGCLSSYDNCTPKTGLYFTFSEFLPRFDIEPLKWEHQLSTYGMNFFDPATGLISTFSKYSTGDADAWIASHNSSQRRYLCDYNENADYTKTIKVYVWDKFANNTTCDDGNYDFANVEINFNHCGNNPHPSISGLVSYAGDTDAFEGMEMVAENIENRSKVMTNTNGEFTFSLSDDEYKIQGSRDVEYLNGVTTLDIVLIQKHLLGTKSITDPYRLIAADANNNGKVTASDILQLRKLILGSKPTFDNNSWVAISKDYQFLNPNKAYAEAEKARVKTVTVNSVGISNLDFIAVKIGDMNSSANKLENRSANSVNLIVDNKKTLENELVEVPFYANDFKDVYGIQFTMDVSNIDIEDITSGAINVNGSNVHLSNNNLVFSWDNARGTSVNDGEVLFTMTVKSHSNSSLNAIMSLNDNIARKEAYVGSDLAVNSVELQFRNDNVVYTLYQNEPNPFTNKTVIGFDLAKDSEYTVSVYDVTGKVVKTYNGFGNAGYNKLEISNKEINTSGVLYYRLESGDYTATRKMIMIK